MGYPNMPDFDVPTIHQHLEHTEIRWGWARGPYTDRSCGGSVYLSHRRFPFRQNLKIKRFHTIPKTAMGRIGICELQGQDRWAPGYLYLPHFPFHRKDVPHQQKTVRMLFDVLSQLLHSLPSGCKPILFLDPR